MRGLIKLAILAAVAYFAYTELLPRYRAHQESRAAHEEADQDRQQARHCVSLAESVCRDFAGEIRRFARPPVDAGMWSTFMIQTSSQLSRADSACREHRNLQPCGLPGTDQQPAGSSPVRRRRGL